VDKALEEEDIEEFKGDWELELESRRANELRDSSKIDSEESPPPNKFAVGEDKGREAAVPEPERVIATPGLEPGTTLELPVLDDTGVPSRLAGRTSESFASLSPPMPPNPRPRL